MPSYTGLLTASGASSAIIAPSASNKSVVLWSYDIAINNAAITVTVVSGSTTKLTFLGAASTIARYGMPSGREPLFQGAPGESITINLSGAAASGVAYNFWSSEIG